MLNIEIKLPVQIRQNINKKNIKELRHKGKIPAILYSKQTKTIPISIDNNQMNHILKKPHHTNALINLMLKDNNNKCIDNALTMIKDIQIHCITRTLQHIDFIKIDKTKKVIVSIKLVLKGKCNIVTSGGDLKQINNKILIKTYPHLIPEHISIDITHLQLGTTYSNDITLPKNIELYSKHKLPIIIIKQPKQTKSSATKE